jgi:hypothetical protein
MRQTFVHLERKGAMIVKADHLPSDRWATDHLPSDLWARTQKKTAKKSDPRTGCLHPGLILLPVRIWLIFVHLERKGAMIVKADHLQSDL